jgi:2-dehydro-3-deoxygluconokinase
MSKVITMGEIMLRLSTPGNERFIQADEFDVCYGGGEANVAVSLANYGYDTEFVTKVPKNPIGECAVAALRKYGVGTKHIAKGGERLGIYFLETGSAMRASNVVYDRAHSAISEADIEDFDFDQIFADADWFHFTGITPAISDKAAELTKAALAFCAEFKGEIPGVSAEECGNYRDHNLDGAKKEAFAMCKVLESWTEEMLEYPTK